MIVKNSFHLTNSEGGYLIIHFLVICFGISAWIGVNGVYIQLPLLVSTAPEGWNLPAYIVIVIQAANIVPVTYTISQQFIFKLNESACILGLLTVGTIAMGLLVVFHDRTLLIGDSKSSLPLLLLIFFTALVGCSSSIVFMPYLRNYSEFYLVSYFIGEGLSGVLPSTVALIQGIESDPDCVMLNSTENATKLRFTTSDYFFFIFAVLLLSLIAFIFLQYCSYVKDRSKILDSNDQPEIRIVNCNKFDSNSLNSRIVESRDSVDVNPVKTKRGGTDENGKIILKFSSKFYLLALMSFLCFFGNGLFPSIQSYSCLPYGNETYHLTVTLSQFANPIACFLAFWILPLNFKAINVLLSFVLIASIYVTYVAIMSPNPPLQKSVAGVVIIIVSSVLLMGFISYVKLIIASLFRHLQEPKALFYVGIVMQAASACGAIFSLVLINYTTIFKSYEPCKKLMDF